MKSYITWLNVPWATTYCSKALLVASRVERIVGAQFNLFEFWNVTCKPWQIDFVKNVLWNNHKGKGKNRINIKIKPHIVKSK
jgi:hypothetical protein